MTKAENTSRVPSFTGKGAKARLLAFTNIRGLSYAEDSGRLASLANMRTVLGNSPSAHETATAKDEWQIGRIASRLTGGALPKGKPLDDAGKLAFAADLLFFKAVPLKEGATAKGLRKGKTGYRTDLQQRVVRAASEACSVFFAELGLSMATPTSIRDKAKKTANAPSMAGSGKGKKGGAAAPSNVTQLAVPALPVTADDYVQHMQTQLAALLAFDNKHAKVRPVTHGAFAEQLGALKQTANKAANDYQQRKAVKTAAA